MPFIFIADNRLKRERSSGRTTITEFHAASSGNRLDMESRLYPRVDLDNSVRCSAGILAHVIFGAVFGTRW